MRIRFSLCMYTICLKRFIVDWCFPDYFQIIHQLIKRNLPCMIRSMYHTRSKRLQFKSILKIKFGNSKSNFLIIHLFLLWTFEARNKLVVFCTSIIHLKNYHGKSVDLWAWNFLGGMYENFTLKQQQNQSILKGWNRLIT